jgi:hypothetical protein
MAGGVTNDRGVFVHPQALCSVGWRGHAGVGIRARRLGRSSAPTATSATTCSSKMTCASAIASRSSPAFSSERLRVADDAFIGPNATFSNDKSPRSKKYQAETPETTSAAVRRLAVAR